ncbi:unnamed protein product [Schistocephalus solidus]|uniref:Uncharacterized protein n=1 Tax=Schistocephalus solidus TaxID=70667 RepID=A0A183TMU4_SCHSO|nr:unnamed protein product [Schistocephalus solidus]
MEMNGMPTADLMVADTAIQALWACVRSANHGIQIWLVLVSFGHLWGGKRRGAFVSSNQRIRLFRSGARTAPRCAQLESASSGEEDSVGECTDEGTPTQMSPRLYSLQASEPASHSVTREATTGFISTTRRQDGDSLQDVTCESHLESDRHSGGSAERLGSAEPELREVPPREVVVSEYLAASTADACVDIVSEVITCG